MRDLPPPARAPLMLLGFVALVAGVAGGLVRLGFDAPAPAAGITWHGALMASAFFGTLISLERAVALGRAWAYLAPSAFGAGAIALLAGATRTGFVLFAAGGVLFAVASGAIWLRQRALHTGVLALGALSLLAANLLLLAGRPSEAAVPSWIAFFVLTIGGERLELSRLPPMPRAARTVFGALAAALFLAGLPFAPRVLGVLLLLMALWLVRYDIATRTVRAAGLTRYIALCLLAGYAWLALGLEPWDAALHAIMLVFVFSMVFGHAPVILPAVLRIAIPYRAALYAPLALLHLSLAVRVAGDLSASAPLRAAGGAGSALAIALFIVTAATLALSTLRKEES